MPTGASGLVKTVTHLLYFAVQEQPDPSKGPASYRRTRTPSPPAEVTTAHRRRLPPRKAALRLTPQALEACNNVIPPDTERSNETSDLLLPDR